MKPLTSFALWFLAGYITVAKIAPFVQAKFEAMNLDSKWEAINDVFDE